MVDHAYLELLPKELSFSEHFVCDGLTAAAKGSGTFAFSFDCDGSAITEKAIEEYQQQFTQLTESLEPEKVEAILSTVGFVAFINAPATNLGELYKSVDEKGVTPLSLPSEHLAFESLPIFCSSAQSCTVSQSYEVSDTNVPFVNIVARIEDELISNLYHKHQVEHHHQLHNDFGREVMFSIELQLLLPLHLKDELDYYVDIGKPPVLNNFALDWGMPDALDEIQVTLKKEGEPLIDNNDASLAFYNPGNGQICFSDLPFELDVMRAEALAAKGWVGFTIPTLLLHVHNFQAFYEKQELKGKADIFLPCLSSGLKAQFFNIYGQPETSVGMSYAASLEVNFGISPEACLLRKTFQPTLYCRFEGVIYDQARLNDIVKVLNVMEFSEVKMGTVEPVMPVIKLSEQVSDQHLDNLPNHIVAKKEAGLRHLMVELIIESTQTFAERERNFVEHGVFRKKIATGQFSVCIRGQVGSRAVMLEDAFYLNRVINDLYSQLKIRISPHARMD